MSPTDTPGPFRSTGAFVITAVLVRLAGIALVVASIVLRASFAPRTVEGLALAGWSVFAVGAGLDLAIPGRRNLLRWLVFGFALAIAAMHLFALVRR